MNHIMQILIAKDSYGRVQAEAAFTQIRRHNICECRYEIVWHPVAIKNADFGDIQRNKKAGFDNLPIGKRIGIIGSADLVWTVLYCNSLSYNKTKK